MAKYTIHQRKSALDKDTKIVTVTKEKSLSETLFGEEDNKGPAPGNYTVHERTSLLDKDTKIVTVTKEKTLSETLFGTEEKQRVKDNKRSSDEYYRKTAAVSNAYAAEESRLYKEQAYNNKVVGVDYTEGISAQSLKQQKEKFDYSKVSADQKKAYLKFVAAYFNAQNKGYSVDFVKLTKKQLFSKKQAEYDGPKYWEIKKDEKEYDLNKGMRFENTILVLDENGEFWNKIETVSPGFDGYTKRSSFSKVKDISDDLIAYVDISFAGKKEDVSLERYLKLDDSSRKKILSDLESTWTNENAKLKTAAKERAKAKNAKEFYEKFILIARFLILPLVLLPILFVVLYLPLYLLIPYAALVSAVYGFVKDHVTVAGFAYMFSLIVTGILMLIRGYEDAFLSVLIMVGLSVGSMYLFSFIESKISDKIKKFEPYR